MKHLQSKRAAFTIVTALAFTMVVGTVLAGVGTVAMSHFGRSKVEGTYANAVSVAEAGINYELARISSDITNSTLADQMSSPRTVDVSTLTGMSNTRGSFTVYVRPYGSDCDGTGTWAAPADMCVVSTGTVDGISRTIRVRGRSMSVFGEYAIYAYKSATFNGGGASDKTGTEGNMGTNGPIVFHGTQGSTMVNGLLSVNGGNASTNSDKGNVDTNPDPVIFPTVTQIANQRFPSGGLSWLSNNNANASIRILKPGDPTLASEPTIAGITLADVNSKFDSAGFSTSTRSLKNAPKTITKDTSTLDVGTLANPRFAMKPTAYSSAVDGRNQKIYFFPPGDYYFSDLELAADACVFLTHLGAIRIWVDSNATTTDDISKNYYIFTDSTPSKFRLYYNKCAQIKMRGHAYFHGSIYGIRDGCSGNKPELDEAGGDAVFGSVIMNGFTISGGSKVVFPNNGAAGDDPALWFGFKDSWKEVKSVDDNNHTVFGDGSDN